MATLITNGPVVVTAAQLRILAGLVDLLEPGEPWMAAVADDGTVLVRSTQEATAAEVAMWRRNPAAMIPARGTRLGESLSWDGWPSCDR